MNSGDAFKVLGQATISESLWFMTEIPANLMTFLSVSASANRQTLAR